MKFNGKSLALSALLLIVLCCVVFIEISIFISGPSQRYADTIKKQEQVIKSNYSEIKQLRRDAFYYITYVGEDATAYVWFNEKGEAIQKREKATLKIEEVKAKIEKDYQGKDIRLELGYGYKNPVYVVQCNQGMILLDYDTLSEIYYLKDGVV